MILRKSHIHVPSKRHLDPRQAICVREGQPTGRRIVNMRHTSRQQSCHGVCFLAPAAKRPSLRWVATPPASAWALKSRPEGRAPVRPALSRHMVRPRCSRPMSRARRSQTGGDPAAPGWHRASLNPSQPERASAPRAAPGSARPLACRQAARLVQRLRSLRSLRPGPQGPALAVPACSPWTSQGVEAARGHC